MGIHGRPTYQHAERVGSTRILSIWKIRYVWQKINQNQRDLRHRAAISKTGNEKNIWNGSFLGASQQDVFHNYVKSIRSFGSQVRVNNFINASIL